MRFRQRFTRSVVQSRVPGRAELLARSAVVRGRPGSGGVRARQRRACVVHGRPVAAGEQRVDLRRPDGAIVALTALLLPFRGLELLRRDSGKAAASGFTGFPLVTR